MKFTVLTPLAFAMVLVIARGQDRTTPLPMKSSKASGPFDVTMTPQSTADSTVGRFALTKQFHGDLEARSVGEMLSAMTATKGSAGYVAIENVTGRLNGRTGTFFLQHTGVMTRGETKLVISVIPDSGTGELAGLTGAMAIRITAEGAHYYEFEYSLPSKN